MAAARYAAKTAYRGEIAAHYDEDRKGETLWAEEQEFVRAWIRRLPAGAIVLDLPVGTGRFIPLLAECGLVTQGFDISEDMVAEARRRHGDRFQLLTLAVGDAERLALPDQSVDAVICWRFFHLIPRPVMDRVLREFRRVCRGPILVQVLQVRLPAPDGGIWKVLKNLLRPWYRRLRPAPVNLPWGHITSYPHREKDLRDAFRAAGLSVCDEVRMTDSGGLPVKAYTLTK